MLVRHIFEISDVPHAHNDENHPTSIEYDIHHIMEDDFALRNVRIYPGVNS